MLLASINMTIGIAQGKLYTHATAKGNTASRPQKATLESDSTVSTAD